MVGPPAVLCVVRHGARLDVADKNWHLNSPTPYDPPLTYGGFQQSRALGARLATLLQEREEKLRMGYVRANTDGANESISRQKRRKHKVVIHTSPFLRCVQTSIAIASGLAQHAGPGNVSRSASAATIHPSRMHSSPRLNPQSHTESPSLAPIPEPTTPQTPAPQQAIQKATLRVDAFLGEWLSPDYFEHITAPPPSVMMVAAAKTELLRHEDYSQLNTQPMSMGSVAGFPGGWNSPSIRATLGDDDDVLFGGGLSQLSLGQRANRDRTNSTSSVQSHGARSGSRNRSHGGYNPPRPHYAINTSAPIPVGFVAHAKDACVDIDYQWDSMREPLNWGDGGEYGEEWPIMHKRFRRGLNSLVNWYKDNDAVATRRGRSGSTDAALPLGDGDDVETEVVVILVTHGAGCNALIGALTNQPVLMDVGMASLTMAYHRGPTMTSPRPTPATTPAHSRVSSRTFTLNDEYEVKLLASSDHLRRPSSTSIAEGRTPVLSAQNHRPSIRYTSNGASSGPFVEPLEIGESARSLPYSGNFGSIRRAASAASRSNQGGLYGDSNPTPSFGLWTPMNHRRRQSIEEQAIDEDQDDSDNLVLNFGDEYRNLPLSSRTPGNAPVKAVSIPVVEPSPTSEHLNTPTEPFPTTDGRLTETEESTAESKTQNDANESEDPNGDDERKDSISPLPKPAPGLWQGSRPARAEGEKRRWSAAGSTKA